MTTKLVQAANDDGTFAVEVAVVDGELRFRARSWKGKWGKYKDSIDEIKFPDNESKETVSHKLATSAYDIPI